MADIPDQPAAWPDIPLIATTDPVLGGMNGAANRQAICMMQRLQMTKDIGDAAAASIDAMGPLVSQARSGADAALLAAQTAQTTADAAGDDADAARMAASAAQSAAVAADTKATNAQAAATTADGKAVAAQAKADSADTKATNAQASAGMAGNEAAQAMVAANSKAVRIDLGAVTITYSAVLAVGGGARSLVVNCTGARVGDAIFVAATGAIPDGYAVGAAQCLVTDVIRVSVVHPALVLGASFSIPLRVFALR